MSYSWDAELIGEIKEKQKANSFHENDFLKRYVKAQARHAYLATPKPNDYLTLSLQQGLKRCSRCHEISNKDICNACMQRSSGSSLAPSTSYTRTGTYDIASKLGLYNPTTSFTTDLYAPKKNFYHI